MGGDAKHPEVLNCFPSCCPGVSERTDINTIGFGDRRVERSLDKKEKRKDRLIGALIVFPRHVFFFFFYYSFTLLLFFFFFKLIITFCSKIFHIRVKEKEKKK